VAKRESDVGPQKAQRWLAMGAAAGLVVAALGVIGDRPSAEDLPPGAVARVGDALIRVEEYDRLVAGLASDRRSPVDGKLRRHVLNRMIDEELLVQRAVELGLVDVDRRVRANLTSAMIQSIVDDADEDEASERELEAFYREHAEFFTAPGRLRVRQIFFRSRSETRGSGEERAEAALAALRAGQSFERVRDELGDREISPLPDAMLPALKLREYIGPTALRSAMALEVGALSEAVQSGTGVHLLQLVEREPERTPPLEEIQVQVRSEWRRRQGDRALRAYLDGLREDIPVVTQNVEAGAANGS